MAEGVLSERRGNNSSMLAIVKATLDIAVNCKISQLAVLRGMMKVCLLLLLT
jgi:hypothetical protein